MIKPLQLFFGCLIFLAANVSAAQDLKIFITGSYTQIVKQYQGQAFIIALWSLDCPACFEELAMLSKAYQQKPFNLVLISVDGIESKQEVETVLNKYQLDKVDNWLFTEYADASLRYEIDPLWYGELPRSYFFDETHQRQGVSGVLKKVQLPQ